MPCSDYNNIVISQANLRKYKMRQLHEFNHKLRHFDKRSKK